MNMTDEDTKKELPEVVMQHISRDAATGMVMTERYIRIKADEAADSLIAKAKEALKD